MNSARSGFTIVELLVTVVVIAILAALAIVSYQGVQQRAAAAVLQSDLKGASTQLEILKLDNNDQYPADDEGLQKSEGVTFQYTYASETNSYCLTATSSRSGVAAYYINNVTKKPAEGACDGHSEGGEDEGIADGSLIQTITSANCPTDRTRAVDARDNHTYWVQELADGKCWMLTHLAYAGGGINTYGDVKALTNGTGGSTTYTTASYYVVPGTTNYTTEPTNPSTSTDGTGQYGYLYNWCGAMGGQATSACANATTPTPDTSVSVCPAGWRLPVGNGGEFSDLNTAVNGGLTDTDAGLRSSWLANWSGAWSSGGFVNQDFYGLYWSSTQQSAPNAYRLLFYSSSISLSSNTDKRVGNAVRCVAN